MSKYDPDYYDKNKDKMKASNKMWYEKNKEAILMKMKEQRLNRTPEQTEEARAKRREYYNNNKEMWADYNKRKRQEQKDKIAALEAKVKELEESNAREN